MNQSRALKAFLSHSSKDKPFADQIADQFSSANLEYDSKTFEEGEQSSSEIFAALERSDVFALLLSRNSVASPWVQSEIALSQHRLFSGGVKKILVFVLDDLPTDQIPPWLRVYVYRKSANKAVVANAIRSVLIDLEHERNPAFSVFLGRDRELQELKSGLASVTGPSPKAMFISGTDGIGRRTLVRRALGDTFFEPDQGSS